MIDQNQSRMLLVARKANATRTCAVAGKIAIAALFRLFWLSPIDSMLLSVYIYMFYTSGFITFLR
jgi:hypothetical protein